MKINFLTYGCKVNQYDTEKLKQLFNNINFSENIKTDFIIINSCTVTEKVVKEILKEIKKLSKDKNKKIILTGCYLEKDFEKIKDSIYKIVPKDKKFDLNYYFSTNELQQYKEENILFNFSERQKAFVKIEDGCNKYCSYCIVPFVRGGKIKIRDEDEILNEIHKLEENGYKELVLTGVNLGLYGSDNLKNLLLKILKIIKKARIRLSSIGPKELSNEIIDIVADNIERLCPHFHLSLQSGDDKILKLMNRDYTVNYYAKKCEYILKKITKPGITTDVITGFPGEGDKEFENTYKFIKSMPITRLHVFSYSDRSGTKSEKMQNKVEEKIKKERTKRLILLSKEKEKDFIIKNKGDIRTVLVENKNKNGFFEGYTENYIKCLIEKNKVKSGNLIKVKIKDIEETKAICEVLN